MNILTDKFKEVLMSVLPIVILTTVLNFTFIHIDYHIFIRFLLGSVCMIIGLAFFLFGIDISVAKIGVHMGGEITKRNKLFILIAGGFILGFLISIAEPDLQIFADQVKDATRGEIPSIFLVLVVSVGVALFVMLGLLRIVFNVSQKISFLISYGIIFILALFSSAEFISISFDSSGTTTGAITVPFILALSLGVSGMKKNSTESEENSFGLVGMASAGAILAVLTLSVLNSSAQISSEGFEFNLDISTKIFKPFKDIFLHTLQECFISLLPLSLIFFVTNFISIKLRRKDLMQIVSGLIITLIGLFLFMWGAKSGFLDVGILIGNKIGEAGVRPLILFIGALIGLVTILAEPAVYVLTVQIENVTSGHIRRKVVLIFLCIGVSLAVMLSMLRIIEPAFQLWHILLPGYIISLILSFIVPDLFVGIAFDAGGVASGPMSATFVLSLAQGLANATPSANVLIDGFGIIAAIALAPIISLQVLGLIFKIKSARSKK
ncbi:DUF1538 domain-containing protein [Treponema pedis]|uniref:DUF1538 domain-containing protein n=2 Tax=Treponema pedis TaxID=409322 RepID=S6A2D6_9SPIR|nr:DUF1538 domain-containing protein [Treponema pedis]AGT45273.1 hypothetical protein TPE_2801 [Treponema pedis str. T A4]QOW60513.1 DUF1538 domain-containing protein [Treponema pedis]